MDRYPRPGSVVGRTKFALSDAVYRTETTVDGVKVTFVRRVIVPVVEATPLPEAPEPHDYRSAPERLRRRAELPAVVPPAQPSRWARAWAWCTAFFRRRAVGIPSACSVCGSVDAEPCDAALHG